MTDCFSLPNAAELVEFLHCEENYFREDTYRIPNPHANIAKAAADAIEALLAENAKLKADVSFWKNLYDMTENERDHWIEECGKMKAERDAAVEDLRSLAHKYSFTMCKCCKNKGSNKCISCHDDPLTLPEYEWRGISDDNDGK